ncbi:hypothetical protein ACSS6W_006906 [Trichoderma asperelloides]
MALARGHEPAAIGCPGLASNRPTCLTYMLEESTLTHILDLYCSRARPGSLCVHGATAGDCRPFRHRLLVSSPLASYILYRFLAALPAAHRPSDKLLSIFDVHA